jgi:isoleucyl-tRNA synthetase
MRAVRRSGASLQAQVVVHADPEATASVLADTLGEEARFLFITADVAFRPADARPDDAVKVEGLEAWITAQATTHAKCIRCWHHRPDVGSHADDPELCGRCVGNIHGPGETRRYF